MKKPQWKNYNDELYFIEEVDFFIREKDKKWFIN